MRFFTCSEKSVSSNIVFPFELHWNRNKITINLMPRMLDHLSPRAAEIVREPHRQSEGYGFDSRQGSIFLIYLTTLFLC